MKIRLFTFACLLLSAGLSLHAAGGPAKLAGTWTLDVARSTPVRPWDKQSITIAVTGETVVLTRNLAWGADRKASDATTVKTDGKTITANPVGYWLETWYTNVYIGGDHQKHVTGEWLEDGRQLEVVLRNIELETRLIDIYIVIARSAVVLLRFGGVFAPLAQPSHLLRQVNFLATFGFNDPNFACRSAHEKIRRIGG